MIRMAERRQETERAKPAGARLTDPEEAVVGVEPTEAGWPGRGTAGGIHPLSLVEPAGGGLVQPHGGQVRDLSLIHI